jgi:hypothetical protein
MNQEMTGRAQHGKENPRKSLCGTQPAMPSPRQLPTHQRLTLEYQPGHRRQARLQPFVSCFIHDNERRSNASTRLLTGRSISASRSARRGVAPRCAVIRSEGRALWPVSALARGYARECSVSRARPTSRLPAGRRASLRRPARRRENARCWAAHLSKACRTHDPPEACLWP